MEKISKRTYHEFYAGQKYVMDHIFRGVKSVMVIKVEMPWLTVIIDGESGRHLINRGLCRSIKRK